MRLNGKTALVTGGNSGIGFATARVLLAHGARVAITGRDQEKLDAATAELGGATIAIQADFDEPDAIARTMTIAKEAFGHLDIVFANAGISGPSTVGSTTAEAFEAIVRTNFTNVFLTVQAAVPLMREGGSIILNSSVMRDAGMPGTAAYAGTKAAVSAMAKVLAAEFAPRGIRVNTVVPGGTRTAIWTRGARQGLTIEAAEERLRPSIPMQRFSEPEEVANAVLFFASADSSFVTAAEIVVDGGMSGAPFAALAPKAASVGQIEKLGQSMPRPHDRVNPGNIHASTIEGT